MKRLWVIIFLFIISCNNITNDATHRTKYELSGFSLKETQTNQDFIKALRDRAEKQAKAENLKREQFRKKVIRMIPLFILIVALILLLLRWKYGLPIVLKRRLEKLHLKFNKLIVFMGINNPGWQRIATAGLIFFLILPIAYWDYDVPLFVYLSDFFEDLIPSIGYSKVEPAKIPGTLSEMLYNNPDLWGEEINLLGKIFFIIYHLTFYILGIKMFTWIKSGFSK